MYTHRSILVYLQSGGLTYTWLNYGGTVLYGGIIRVPPATSTATLRTEERYSKDAANGLQKGRKTCEKFGPRAPLPSSS